MQNCNSNFNAEMCINVYLSQNIQLLFADQGGKTLHFLAFTCIVVVVVLIAIH